MAWSNVGSRGTNNGGTTADTTIARSPTSTLIVGQVIIIAVTCDNTGTTDSTTETDTNEITGVSDNAASTTNVWTKLGEWLASDGSAADGGVGALFACKITTQVNTTDTVTASFANSTAGRTISINAFSVGSGNTFSMLGAAGQSVDSGTAISVTVGSLANAEHLWVCIQAAEGISTANLTIDANFVQLHEFTTGGTTATNMTQQCSYRILTATTETFDCTWGAARDGAVLLIALDEVAPGTTITVDTPGAITFTGQSVTLAYTEAVSPGAVSWSGQTGIGLIHSFPLTAGAVTWTGQSVPLVQKQVVSAGAVTWAGATDITLSVTGGGTIVSVTTPGAVTWTGSSVTLAYKIGITAGAITWTGQDLGVVHGLPVTAGALTWTGQSIALNYTIGITAGAVTWQGSTGITVQAGGNVVVSVTTAGQVSWTGQSVTLAYKITPVAGAVTWTGQSGITLQHSFPLTPGAVTWTGSSIGLRYVVAVSAGAVTWTGQGVSLVYSIIPVAGAVTFTGRTVTFAYSIGVEAGHITLAGQDVILGGSGFATPVRGPTRKQSLVQPTAAEPLDGVPRTVLIGSGRNEMEEV